MAKTNRTIICIVIVSRIINGHRSNRTSIFVGLF